MDVEVFFLNPTELVRPNGVTNPALFLRLVQSMRGGWNGPPLVVLDRSDYDPPLPPLAITGSHRTAAAEKADLDVPCVQLASLFQHYELDLDNLLDDWLPPGGIYTDAVVYRAIARILHHLSSWMIGHYGLNLKFCRMGAQTPNGHLHMCATDDDEHCLDDDYDGWHVCITCGQAYEATGLYEDA